MVGRIGWIDERMVDKKSKRYNLNNMPQGGTIRDTPFPSAPKSKFKWITIHLGKHKNWKENLKIYEISLAPVIDSKNSYGRFLIWRIELLKAKGKNP